jgi:ABC-type nitrate/sulfonate/bicarbonate transport system permease component
MTDTRSARAEQGEAERVLGESVAFGVETPKSRERRSLLESLHGMPPWVGAVIGIVVVLVIWEIVSITFYPKTQSIPQPGLVGKQLIYDLFQTNVYWNAIAKTGGAALWGYLWGNLVALFLAFLVLIQPWFENISTQLAVITSCIPLTAIGPIVTLLAPAGSRSTSIFLAALSVIFTTVIGTLLGLRAASETQIDVIRAYGGGRMTQLFKVRLIAALPSILAALKLAAPAAFLGAVLGEYFTNGVDSGIGILLLAAQATGASVRLWALALLSAGVAGLAYFVIGRIGRLIAPWSSGDTRAGEGF